MINQAIHTLDLMQYLCGQRTQTVEAVLDNQHLGSHIEIEDTMAAYIKYPETRACFYASNSYSIDSPVMIDLDYEKARIRIEETEVSVRTTDGEKIHKEFIQQPQYGKSYWGSSHKPCIEEYYQCLENGKSYMLEWNQIEDTVKLFLDIYASARKKFSGRE